MTSRQLEHTTNNHDWFLAAIESNGSVGDCLEVVASALQKKQDFVKALSTAIAEKSRGLPDSVSDIGQRIRTLENTLRFRLTILSPERKGAWFRAGSATVGPFKEILLSEPVFSAYDEMQHGRIRQGLTQCWEARHLIDYPMRATQESLWHVLLSLNFELDAIDRLGDKFPRLTELPAKLPSYLESRSLKAFLINVRAEVLSHRNRLTDCYRTLLDACDHFWQYHATVGAKKSAKQSEPFEFRSTSSIPRDRRATTAPRSKLKNSSDLEALKFMGFADFPKPEDLKQRYHQLAREMHPDRPSGNEQRFKMLNKSYKHLVKMISF